MKDEYARHLDILKEHNYDNFTIVGHGTKGHHFLLARHNRAHKDPLKSILKKEEDLNPINEKSEDEYSEDSGEDMAFALD